MVYKRRGMWFGCEDVKNTAHHLYPLNLFNKRKSNILSAEIKQYNK